MDTIAKVVRVNGQLMGEVLRSEACAKCGACSHGLEEKRYYPLPEGEWHEGDQVTISLPDTSAFAASVLAYGIPLAGLRMGRLIGALLGLADLWQGAAALAGLALGWLALKLLEPRLKRSGRFCPKVR